MATDAHLGGSPHDGEVQTVLVPPLLCSAGVYAPLLDAVWRHGAVTVADTGKDESIAGMATRLLRDAPERFALLGTSMGGTWLSRWSARHRTASRRWPW